MDRSRRGQMSLIMILLIGIGLILFAVSVNWSRIATTKASVTIASNMGTSKIVSMVASYGEYLIQTQLGGVVRKCSSTSVLVAIIVFIVIIIIAIVVACFSYGTGGAAIGGAAAGGTLFFAAVAVVGVLALASIVVQATVIQPGLTKQWNKWQQGLSTQEDTYLEQGLQTMITNVISDPVDVADRWDGDMDGRWWSPEKQKGTNKKEKISRFAYYYTDRMKNILKKGDSAAVKELQDVLRAISMDLGLYSGSSSGTLDPVCYTDPANPSTLRPECNPCCVDRTMRAAGTCYQDVRTQLERDAGVKAWERPLPNGVPAVHPGCNNVTDYDPLYENRNSTDSAYNNTLVKAVGLDDGNKESPLGTGYFRAEDATKGSVFPMLWAITDSEPNLTSATDSVSYRSPACHWCSTSLTQATGPLTCNPMIDHLYRPGVEIPANPYTNLATQLGAITCSGTNCCTNYFWAKPTVANAVSSVTMDKVKNIQAFENTQPNTCANEPTDIATKAAANQATNAWKKGADYGQDIFTDTATEGTYQFKMSTTPGMTPAAIPPTYGTLISACAGTTSTVDSCLCSGAPAVNKPYWNDDVFDMLGQQFSPYKATTDAFLKANTASKRAALAASPDSWADQISAQADTLDKWTGLLSLWSNSMQKWASGPYADDSQWCVPSQSSAASLGVSSNEKNAITLGTSWGSLQSVVNCLDYNASTTNSSTYSSCLTNCNYYNAPCRSTQFMRSPLTPSFYPNSMSESDRFLTIDEGSCTQPTWQSLCEGSYPSNGFGGQWEYCGQGYPYANYTVTTEAECTAVAGVWSLPGDPAGTCSITKMNQAACDINYAGYWHAGQCYYDYNLLYAKSTCPTPAWSQNWQPHGNCKSDTVNRNKFKEQLQDTLTLLGPLQTKMAKRSAYLTTIMNQVMSTDPSSFKSVIDAANTYLNNFPDPDTGVPTGKTAAQTIRDLVTQIKNEATTTNNLSLGNTIVYGWFSKRPDTWNSGGRGYGYLHLVKVSAALPKRSTGVYALSGLETCSNLNADKFQEVKTQTSSWGLKRCYYLDHTGGCVGSRVIRYDEDHDPKQGGVMKFLSGLPLWQITYHNPHSSGYVPTDPNDPNKDIWENCMAEHYSKRYRADDSGFAVYKKLDENDDTSYNVPCATGTTCTADVTGSGGFPSTDTDLTQAFMLNLPLDETALGQSTHSDAANKLIKCRDAVEARLQQGIFSETCAKYYVSGNLTRMKFAPCKTCCSATEN